MHSQERVYRFTLTVSGEYIVHDYRWQGREYRFMYSVQMTRQRRDPSQHGEVRCLTDVVFAHLSLFVRDPRYVCSDPGSGEEHRSIDPA